MPVELLRPKMEVKFMKIYFTITGTHFRYGQDFLKKGMKVRLEKEPDNKYDTEAILVKMEGLGKIGYVANSTHTVLGESWSAGRLYDKIGDTAKGKVFLVMDKGVLCVLDTKKNKLPEPEDKGHEAHDLRQGQVPAAESIMDEVQDCLDKLEEDE